MSKDRFFSGGGQSEIDALEETTAGTITYPTNTYSGVTDRVVYKTGNILMINFTATLNIGGSIAGSGGLICTLPEGYRPSKEVRTHIYTVYSTSEGKGVYNVKIGTDGTVKTGIGGGTISTQVILESAIPINPPV